MPKVLPVERTAEPAGPPRSGSRSGAASGYGNTQMNDAWLVRGIQTTAATGMAAVSERVDARLQEAPRTTRQASAPELEKRIPDRLLGRIGEALQQISTLLLLD